MGPPEKKPAPPLFEWTQVPADAPRHVQGLAGVQLAPGPRGRHRQRPQQLPPRRPAPGPALRRATTATRPRPQPLAGARSSRSSRPTTATPTPASATMGDEGQLRPRLPLGHALEPAPRPAATAGNGGHMWVPIDDENTMVYNCSSPSDDRAAGAQPDGCSDAEASLPLWFRDARGRRRRQRVRRRHRRREQLPLRCATATTAT